jgi:membrane protease subunit HflK
MSDFTRNVSPPNFPVKITPRLLVAVAVGFLVVVGGLTSMFIVDQTEQAVVTTFGKFNRVVEAGLNFKMPFGIEQNYNVQTQVTQKADFGFRSDPNDGSGTIQDIPEESIMLTGDLNIIDVQWIIQYRIENIENWLFKVKSRTKTIRDISQSVVNELVGDRTLFEVLGNARTTIENQAVEEMNKLFDRYELGIVVTQVKLQNVVPPTGKVRDAFDDVNKAQQDMNRMINEGNQKYNSEIPRASGSAKQIIQQAEGYAAERVNQAEGDVARFRAVLALYQADPVNTRVRLYNEMIEDVFGKGGSSGNAADSSDKTNLIDKKLPNLMPFLNAQGAKLPGVTSGGAQ